MDCPKCIGKLQKILVGTFEQRPFHVDQCFLCRGFWFDSGELEQALSLNFTLVRPAEDDEKPSTRFDYLNEKPGPCPRCKKDMIKIPSLRDFRIKLDACGDCKGYWTDGGELELLSKGGYLKRAVKVIVKFFEEEHKRRNTRYQGGPPDL